jgi:hypothetical protein
LYFGKNSTQQLNDTTKGVYITIPLGTSGTYRFTSHFIFKPTTATQRMTALVAMSVVAVVAVAFILFVLMYQLQRPMGLESAANDPKAWTLSASNDKQFWTQLETRSNQFFAGRGEKKLIPLENETIYKYYQLEILSNGGGSSTEMAEWSLERYSVLVEDGISDLLYGGGVITPLISN